MESRAKLFGHPIHQMLIAFPLGLLAMAVIFDLAAIVSSTAYWAEIAYWMMASGLITALIAAPFGVIDWLAIPSGTRAKTIGALHGGGNVLVIIENAETHRRHSFLPCASYAITLVRFESSLSRN